MLFVILNWRHYYCNALCAIFKFLHISQVLWGVIFLDAKRNRQSIKQDDQTSQRQLIRFMKESLLRKMELSVKRTQ
jgi:hypothetical protein